MAEFRMPSLGADMDAGTVSEWLVKPGDEVRRGDIVAVVETEKSTIEVEIFESGVIEEILVQPGQRVPVGTVLAHVVASAPARVPAVGPPSVPGVVPAPVSGRPEERLEVQPETPPSAPAFPARVPAAPGPTVGPGHVVSPVVRRLAQRLGVDLASVRGSGLDGTLTRADVERAAMATRARGAHRVPSSPLARRLAAELGVDLTTLRGTGPGGSVSAQDVRLAASLEVPVVAGGPPTAVEPEGGMSLVEAHAPSAGAERVPVAAAEERQAAMRRAIGALMARSKREIPHYYLSTTIDMRRALAWLERENLERSVTERLVVAVLLLKATALAVCEVPEMNGFMVDEEFVPSQAVHVGVAVSLRGGGVIAPAIHDTDKLSLDELMAALRDLVGRARKGVLRSSEMSDPTITVTNLGDLGVEVVFGVIYPPQVALVGFGRVLQRPWASEGMLGVASCMTATLSADHRASDGHRGGLFLAQIDHLLQEPERLQ